MTIKVFILGGVGGGKTTAKNRIGDFVKTRGVAQVQFNIYDILKHLYQEDKEHARSQPIIENGKEVGFLVTDLLFYDDTDILLAEQIRERERRNKEDLLLIEIAARNYADVFGRMHRVYPAVFSNAYFLFISTPLEERIRRIQKRNVSPREDTPFLNEEVIRRYQDDGSAYISSTFTSEFGIPDGRVRMIENTGAERDFLRKIEQYAEYICACKR